MKRFEMGMKIYDEDWYHKYHLSYDEAARCLSDWGVTFVMAKSRLLAMPDSGIESRVRPEMAERYASYNDSKFRDALAREGIGYWATSCFFFEPEALAADGSLRPIGSDGQPMEQVDWYVGISPSMEQFVAAQTKAIERGVQELEPDGVFLSFTRWPGFWERWMPHNSRLDFPEYSYDWHTLDRFVRESGVELPTRSPSEAAMWIEENARQTWTDWKCQVIVDVIRQVKESCHTAGQDPGIMLNTLPFGSDDFDGAREAVFGQHIEALADVVDVFEVMTYHQILRRPTSWIPEAGEEVKRRSGRKTLCTVQARPIYLDGIYASDKRSTTLQAEEFAEAVDLVSESRVDGIVVFTWLDLLEEALIRKDSRRTEALRSAINQKQVRDA